GADDHADDFNGIDLRPRREVADQGRQNREQAEPRLGEFEVVAELGGRRRYNFSGVGGHAASRVSKASRCATQVSQKVVASVIAPTSTWPVVIVAVRWVQMICAPRKICNASRLISAEAAKRMPSVAPRARSTRIEKVGSASVR